MKFPLLVLLSIAHAEREGLSLQSNRDLGRGSSVKYFITLPKKVKQQVEKWADRVGDAVDAAESAQDLTTEIEVEDNLPTNTPVDSYVRACTNETHACTNCNCSCDYGGDCVCEQSDYSSCRPQTNRLVLSCFVPGDGSSYSYDRVCSRCLEDQDRYTVGVENCGPAQCKRSSSHDGTLVHICTGCSVDDQGQFSFDVEDGFCHSLYQDIPSYGPRINALIDRQQTTLGGGEKGAISGGTVGAVVVIFIAGFIFKEAMRKEKKEGEADNEVKEEGKVDNEVKS